MRLLKKVILRGLLVVMATGLGAASSPETAVQPVGEPQRSGRFIFRVTTPPPSLTKGPEGTFEIQIEGFGTRDRRPGVPDIPMKTIWVAIPGGVVPRLAVSSRPEGLLRGVRPRPVPTPVSDMLDAGDDPPEGILPGPARARRAPAISKRERWVEDEAVYRGPHRYPHQVAWLGETGTFRDQHYVEVHLAPVRYDPSIKGLRIAASYDVTVDFDGDTLLRSQPRTDPRFESVYRGVIANYEQGTTFRLNGPSTSTSISPLLEAEQPQSVTLSPPLRRLKIRQNGVVRLDSSLMTGTGFLTENLSTWKLTNRGVEVPLQIHDVDGDDVMDAGVDWVQCYGQALDDEPKAVLNTDLPNPNTDIFEARDFTDENTYFLTTEAGGRSRMSQRASAPTNTRVPPPDFEALAHVETDDVWRPLGGADPWYWLPTQSNPSSGSAVASRTEGLSLPGLSSGTLPVRVVVRLRGTSEDSATFPDHHTSVTLKNPTGPAFATDLDNGTFDGRSLYTHDFTWPGTGGVLTNTPQVVIDATTVTGSAGYKNQLNLDFIELRYRRLFQAASDVLTFDWPDGDAEFIATGLSNSQPDIYEITGRVGGSGVVNAVRLTGATASGGGPFSVRFRVDNDPALADGTSRRFVVAGNTGASVPAGADFTADTVSDLRNNATQADLIVIAHPSVLNQAPGSPLADLLALRASQGITSKVALLEDVADEFNDGLPGPLAIQNFLRWVISTTPGEGWTSPKPAFVILLGDGSYDYKGGTASGNFVPTQIMFKDEVELGYYTSDSRMAAVVGSDQVEDLTIGRLPARTVAEADTMLDKIWTVETAPPSGNWRRHALMVSDRGKRACPTCPIDAAESANFEATNAAALAFMKQPPHNYRNLRYYSDYCTITTGVCDATAMHDAIEAGVNGTDGFDGASIMQYDGHSNFNVWSDDRIWDQGNTRFDVFALTNGYKLPWLLAHNCLSGGFHTTAANSNGEDWLKWNAGGAVALFSPSGLSFSFIGDSVSGIVWNDLFGPRKERSVAVPVLESVIQLCIQGSIEACQNYIFLGDPSMTLTFPSVGAPANLGATAGAITQRIDLSWTASATAGATYDVYRTTSPQAVAYTKVNGAPIAGTTFADTGLANMVTYYYYLLALDTQGFESRWSNFNSDCGVNGPDCVKATPTNPNPPAPPTGLTVTDPETSGRLNLTWNANGESDVTSYTVHYGTSSGVYTVSQNAGQNTTAALIGVVNGTTYYVVLTATNSSARTSGFSQEKTGKPTFVRGVKSPAFIKDLMVSKSGGDALLTWGAVTTDIYGKPETVVRYDVYRGTTPNFVPSPATRIGQPAAPAFTDGGALGGATPSYHYLVRAVDNDGTGNGGGLGNQLPNGIDTLTAGKSVTPGNVVLSWPIVGVDFDGTPILIDHYELYTSSQRFTRGDIRDGLLAAPQLVFGTSVDIPTGSGNQYYSVLAVDARGNQSPF